ncbi:MAG TPA: LacI family DNA-binding transcriptional regulator, partial [Chitinophaga sp.]|nr:LacI family DNA-binding transcriptional regulator [Chitinophaga sp.]
MEQITIKDIAKALQLSVSTVSRALKGSYKISESTQRLVRDYAEKHNYKPNLIAQGLKNKKSRCIGVALCSIPNSFFAEVISGIESVAYNKDYLVIVTQNFESFEREVRNLENLT